MTKTSPAILGFQHLSEETTKLANHFKMMEESIHRLLDATQGTDLDPRWIAIARTKIHEGFMALNRANFKPGRVAGTIDLNDVMEGAEAILKERRARVELAPGAKRFGEGAAA